MRRWILLFLLLLPSLSWGAISEVGSGTHRAEGICDNTSGTCTAAYANNVTSGNLLVAGGVWYAPSSTAISQLTITSTCTTGNWTIDGDEHGGGSPNDVWNWIAYAVATSSSACTITATGTGAAGSYFSYGASEFTGQHASTPHSVDGGNSSGTATSASDAITTATANELIIGVFAHGSAANTSITPGGSYTQINEEEDGVTHAAYNLVFRIATTATSYTVDFTVGTSTAWMVSTHSFQEAVGGAAAETFGFRRRRP